MKDWIIYLICGLIFLIISSVMLPDILIKHKIESYLNELLDTDISVESASLSFFSNSLILKNITVSNPENYKNKNALKIEQISVSLSPTSLLSSTIEIQDIDISSPTIIIESSANGYNYNDFRRAISKQNNRRKNKYGGQEKHVIIDNLAIEATKIYINIDNMNEAIDIPLPKMQFSNLGKEDKSFTFKKTLAIIVLEIAKHATKIDKSLLQNIIQDLKRGISFLPNNSLYKR